MGYPILYGIFSMDTVSDIYMGYIGISDFFSMGYVPWISDKIRASIRH